MKQYPDCFEGDGAHGHAYRLLADAKLGDGIVLDLGCAAGPLAEPVRETGREYVGADIDRAAIEQLRGRGFEGHELDLSLGEDELAAALDGVLGGRAVAAVLLLDVIEHLVDPAPLLSSVARLAQEHAGLQLVVSIPNVTHVDVGIKLLLGRWDVTDIGLLDDTHVRFYNGGLVEHTLARAGWVEADANDVVNAFSDQLFPADAPALRPGAPLRQLLWRVRMAADAYGETYQFVRRYAYDPVAAGAVEADAVARFDANGDDVFLSVVIRASDAAEGSLDHLLADLACQDVGNIEVLVSRDLGHEAALVVPKGLTDVVRMLEPAPGIDWCDAAIGVSRGRYIALLDDRTRLSSRYVGTVRRAVEALPGRVVQVATAAAPLAATKGSLTVDDVIEGAEPVELDPLDLVSSVPLGQVAVDAHAFPRHAWATNGLRFTTDAGETAPTLFLVRAIELCGIVRSSERVVVVHPSVVRSLASDIDAVQKHLSLAPLVLPEGAGSQVLALRQSVASAIPERDVLAEQLSATQSQIESLSWNLRHRDGELARVRAEAHVLRSKVEGRLINRVRRRLGSLVRRI